MDSTECTVLNAADAATRHETIMPWREYQSVPRLRRAQRRVAKAVSWRNHRFMQQRMEFSIFLDVNDGEVQGGHFRTRSVRVDACRVIQLRTLKPCPA